MDDQRNIHCATHGENPPCMVCCHLSADAMDRGFNAAQDPDPNPEFAHWREVWCDRCDRWWARLGRLSFLYNFLTPRPRLICAGCLDNIRIVNERPGRERGWWER